MTQFIKTTRAAARELDRAMSDQYNTVCSHFKLRPIDVEILFMLYQRDGLFLPDIHTGICISPSFCSVRLSVLESQGWVERKDTQFRPRAVKVWLTEKAKRAREPITQVVLDAEAGAMDTVRILFSSIGKGGAS